MAKSPTRVTNRPSVSCALSWRFFEVEQWTDFRLDGCWYLWPLFSFYLLGSDWKIQWKLVVGLWKELVQCFYWNRCRVSWAARNFDKMAQTTSYNFLLRTKKSAPLFPLFLLILTAGKTDLLLRKLYRGKLFLKTFFTDFINGQKEIWGTHVTRAVLSSSKLYISLILFKNMTLSKLLILAVCRTHVIQTS